jgi:hypothetical protein
MKTIDALKEFHSRILQAGKTVDALTLSQGIGFMFDFYRDVRASGCRIKDDGDMLLYQWGTYEFDKPRSFSCDITRQFIHTGFWGGGDGMSQLSLTFHFTPSAESDAFKSGNKWCETPETIKSFEDFLVVNPPYVRFHDVQPDRVTLNYDRV